MVKAFIKKWEENKDALKEVLRNRDQEEYLTYKYLVAQTWGTIFGKRFNLENLVEVDHGDYQGMLLYLVPEDTYQPSIEDYIFTRVYYGSCSGCDTLQGIIYDTEGEETLRQLMLLCLHIIQETKWLAAFKNED